MKTVINQNVQNEIITPIAAISGSRWNKVSISEGAALALVLGSACRHSLVKMKFSSVIECSLSRSCLVSIDESITLWAHLLSRHCTKHRMLLKHGFCIFHRIIRRHNRVKDAKYDQQEDRNPEWRPVPAPSGPTMLFGLGGT